MSSDRKTFLISNVTFENARQSNLKQLRIRILAVKLLYLVRSLTYLGDICLTNLLSYNVH
jgi:hypothetical protein